MVQAPEHAIENKKNMEKALAKFGDDSKKIRQVVKKKPPQGFVTWGEKTYERIIASTPEPLSSSFVVTHSMLLNLLDRKGDSFAAARRLLTENHETPAKQRALQRKALGILRELLATGVVERLDVPDEYGNKLALTVHLQQNFALNQPLSPFALAALELFDEESPELRT